MPQIPYAVFAVSGPDCQDSAAWKEALQSSQPVLIDLTKLETLSKADIALLLARIKRGLQVYLVLAPNSQPLRTLSQKQTLLNYCGHGIYQFCRHATKEQ
jgi:hypothetical protein